MGRIVDVTLRGTSLRTNTGRLMLTLPDGDVKTLPFRDVEVLMLSECAVDLTGCVLADLVEAGVPIVLCGHTYQPVGLMMPSAVFQQQARVLRGQILAHPSTYTRLWQRIVRAKIAHQASYLRTRGLSDLDLRQSLLYVTRGDTTNAEGYAARAYWRALALFVRRDPSAPDANALLNYCYTVIYAAAIRALCAVGLHPGLGIHHCNPHNAGCLASDMMEPFRIAADHAVVSWIEQQPNKLELTSTCKAALLRTLLASAWRVQGGETSLSQALQEMALSLRTCILENSVELEIPEALCA